MSLASVRFARSVGAWMILSALTLSFSVQLFTHFRELRMEDWLSAKLCGAPTSLGSDESTRANAKLAKNP